MAYQTQVYNAPQSIGGYWRTTARTVVVFLTLLMFAFAISHRLWKEGSSRSTDPETGEGVWMETPDPYLWGGSRWWDVLYTCCLWAPLGLIALAVTSMDRSGDNLTLEALDENLKDTNKAERVLREVQAKIWKQRFVVGKGWYRTTWSWGDMIATSILVMANLIWGFFGYLKAAIEHADYLAQIEDKAEYQRIMAYFWAYFVGYAGMFDAGLTILFTLRENHLMRTTMGPEGGQYFHGIKYHIGLGYLTFAILTVHSFVILGVEMYWSDYDVYHVLNPAAGWLGHTDFWGLIAWIALTLMVIGSLWVVRRWNYRVFYWSHQLYIVFLFGAAVHFPTAIYPIVGALLYFSLDRLAPYLNFSRGVTAKATRVADEIIRIDVPLVRLVNQEYAPGDWYNLRIPSVNLINWHPFSIGSFYRNTPSHATVFVKARGSWTDKLLKKVPEFGETLDMKLHVEGPFGTRAKTYLHTDAMAIMGAGTGICAVLPYAFQYSLTHPDRKVTAIWIARCVEDVACYPELYQMCKYLERNGNFELKMHLTREESTPPEVVEVGDETEVNLLPSEEQISRDESNDEKHSPGDDNSEEYTSSGGDVRSTSFGTEKVIQENQQKARVYGYYGAMTLIVAVFGVGLFSFFWPRALQGDIPSETCDQWQRENPETGEIAVPTLSAYEMFTCYYWQAATMTISVLMGTLAGAVVILAYPFFVQRVERQQNFKPPVSLTRSQVTTKWIVGRPNIEEYIDELSEQAASTSMMAAGPERLVIQIENLVAKRHSIEFTRESWKV